LIGLLALAGAAPATAQSKPDQGTSVAAATSVDPAAERNSYTNHAQGEMHIWEQKLHDSNAKGDQCYRGADKRLQDSG
jgi:hypothetical protein